MARLTRQEQAAIWVLLVLLAGGAAGRWWIRHSVPASGPAPAASAASAPGKPAVSTP